MNPSPQPHETGLEERLRTLIVNNRNQALSKTSTGDPGHPNSGPRAFLADPPSVQHTRSIGRGSFVTSQPLLERDQPSSAAREHKHRATRQQREISNSRAPHRPGNLQPKAPHRNTVSSGLPPPATGNLHHFPPLGAKIIPPLPPQIQHHVPYSHGPENQRSGVRAPYQQQRPPNTYDWQSAEQTRALDALAKDVLMTASPTPEEISTKEKLLRDLESACKQVVPTAQLIPFGSIVTGFATRGSDVDCVFTSNSDPALLNANTAVIESQSRLAETLVEYLKEAGYDARLLTRTRVPIIKLVRSATVEVPESVSCDIGFNNFLAIHNTQLLKTYAACDERLTGMVLFIKWWAKKRHINSPYRGTLSSYGYALMIVHYLMNIVKPPVLPNLQLFPTPDLPGLESEYMIENNGNLCNIWYYKGVQTLAKSANKATVGELLRGFFEYYAFKYNWQHDVVSIRTPGGILTKQAKNWCAARTRPGGEEEGQVWEVKDRYLLAIEDPFEITHNVARTCTFNGVGRIKVELKRAMYMIRARDGGQRLRADLFQEAPPERPFVRHDKANVKHEIPVPAEDMGGKDTIPTAGGHLHHLPATIEAAGLLTTTPDPKAP